MKYQHCSLSRTHVQIAQSKRDERRFSLLGETSECDELFIDETIEQKAKIEDKAMR